MKKIISKLLTQETKNKLHKIEARFAVARHGHPASKIKVVMKNLRSEY